MSICPGAPWNTWWWGMTKRRWLMIEIEDEWDDGVDELTAVLSRVYGATNGRVQVLGIHALRREFGRSYRGMGQDVLPTGPETPNRGQEQYVRWVSSWMSITPVDWQELGSERERDDEA